VASILEAVTVKLKDGRTVQIRLLKPEDKDKLVEMYESLSSEAVRWGMPPYTRETLEGGWFRNLQHITAVVAFYGDKIVGHAQIFKFPHPRRKGTADLLTYVHQDFQNVGLGAALLSRLIEIARNEGLRRIGLYVVADNKRAIRLYQKFGFKIEGVMRDAYFGDDGKYHDMLVMGLLLE